MEEVDNLRGGEWKDWEGDDEDEETGGGSIMREETAGVFMMMASQRHFAVINSPHSRCDASSLFHYPSLHLSVDIVTILSQENSIFPNWT